MPSQMASLRQQFPPFRDWRETTGERAPMLPAASGPAPARTSSS